MKKTLLWVVVGLAVLAGGAPFWNADRFGPRIRAGLEGALGRKVEIGAVRLHLLTGPGFSVRKVVIHERPEISAEPFAYVDDLVVRVRLLSLLRGRLEFSSLRLDKPHVNLMRRADGAWNLKALLVPPPTTGGAGGDGGERAPLPELEVRRGRLNFKIDNRKSVYYFTGADIDVAAAGEGNFDIWFVGEMARTDRMARGVGRVTAQGRLRDSEAEPKIDLDVQLERSAVQELAQLAGVRDIGVHGVVTSRARVSGPPSGMEIKGELKLSELHHWTQPPRDAAVSVSYAGSLEMGAQRLRLETDAGQPVRVKLGLEQFLTQGHWTVEAEAAGLKLEPMGEWLRPPGSDFDGMRLAGSLDGKWRAAHDAGVTGTAALAGLEWTWGEENRLTAEKLEAEWKDGELRLAPATVQLDGQPLQVDCAWRSAGLAWECHGGSRGHEMKRLQRWMKALGLRAAWVEGLTGGTLRGALTVGQEGVGALQWRGQLELRNGELPVPELGVPVKLAAATVLWQQERLTVPAMRASAGGLEWNGSYRYEAGAGRPHRLMVEMEELGVEGLEKLLGPTGKGTGLLSRALGMEEARESEGAELELRAKRAGALENVRATVWREGPKVTLRAVTADWRGGKVTGAGVARLGGEAEMAGKVTGVRWEGGVVEAEWKAGGRGRLRWTGKASLTGGPVEMASGSFVYDGGKVTLTGVEGQVGGRRVTGRVAASGEELLVELGEGVRMRVSQRPFAVTLAEGR
jgi:hypothetical protein